MQTQLVNFTIPRKILAQVDNLAKAEARSRSELFRESIRRYLLEQVSQKEDFKRIKKAAARIDLDEERAIALVEKARDELLLNK